jgi:hypothetical protein
VPTTRSVTLRAFTLSPQSEFVDEDGEGRGREEVDPSHYKFKVNELNKLLYGSFSTAVD